jgi:HKD family nuclease
MEIIPKRNFEKSERNQMDLLFNNIKNCKNFKISVAYFTDVFESKRIKEKNIFVDKLKNDSFVCVAPFYPTEFNFLRELKDKNCNLFICGPHKIGSNKTEYFKLMHTKIYLFEMSDFVEIWIGSMNFTKQAIKGNNFECNIKFQCSYDDERYIQIIDYLEYIKSLSGEIDTVDLDKLELILKDQNSPKLGLLFNGSYNDIIFLQTKDFDSLKIKEEGYLQLLFLYNDTKKYLNKNEKILIAFIDIEKKSKQLFEFRVSQIGDIEEGKTNIIFEGDKPFGLIIQSKKNPVFMKEKFSIVNEIEYRSFLTLKLIKQVFDEVYYSNLEIELFTERKISPLPSESSDLLEQRIEESITSKKKKSEKEESILFLNPEIYNYTPIPFNFDEMFDVEDLNENTKALIKLIEGGKIDKKETALECVEYFRKNSPGEIKLRHLLIPPKVK